METAPENIGTHQKFSGWLKAQGSSYTAYHLLSPEKRASIYKKYKGVDKPKEEPKIKNETQVAQAQATEGVTSDTN